MKTLTFLLSTVIELYTMALLLRVWMQWARCDFYNPFSQFVVKITQPIVGPLRRVIPAMGPIDSASLLVAFILSVIKAIVLFMVITFQPIIWIAAVLILIKTVGLLIFWVLLVMAIMSWVSQGRSPVEYALIQLAEPLLRPIRNLLPSMGGIDFSPMILVLLLYVVNMGIAELLRLYIQPKASRDSIVGLHGDELKVAITAPPVDGQANAHLTKYLAKQFRVAKSQVIIEKGELGRHKQVKILNPQSIPTEVAALTEQD
jgi:YggT family protein